MLLWALCFAAKNRIKNKDESETNQICPHDIGLEVNIKSQLLRYLILSPHIETMIFTIGPH